VNSFESYFFSHKGRRVDKWRHYFPIYDRHLQFFRSRFPRVLEIGVDHGGSLQIWRDYFGGSLGTVVGLDIDPRCKEYEEPGIEIVIGNQSDVVLLKSLGYFDVVIDDGSHNIQDQEASFEALWPFTDGVYIIEDIHGAYPGIAEPLMYRYPQMLVIEKPRRLIRGKPSRELRPDEIKATEKYGCL